ncbi:hypothetical protein H8R13_04620 [Morganella morganii]|uniref:hypothetical protein n=1 Tax=Morganella morganii TaxID=582 RepID=UPI00164A3B3B|nr:hypothetical protein [Morganella morganii]MBC4011024.1 hypothetical protein [Morganella morganii]MCF1267355.1 hypothetical protein [Morganella morganii]
MPSISGLLRHHQVTPEEKCLKRMSKLPEMNTLLEKTSHIKNTDSEFKGKYININPDIGKLSCDILSFQYKTELSSLKRLSSPISEKNENVKKILNDRVKGWYDSEKITTPATIVYREIDKICAEKNIRISTKEKETILDIVNEKHIKLNGLEKKASVTSMINPLKLDKNLSKEINEPGIKKNLIKDMKKEFPEQFKFLTDQFHKNDAVIQKEELLSADEKSIFYDIPIVRETAGKMVSDVYNGLIENIYNVLFRNNEQPLDFVAIKAEVRTQVEHIAKDKNFAENNNISAEDIIRKAFESKIKLTSSSPEQDIENLFAMMNKGDISDQRYEFNSVAKATSPSPEQDIDDLFAMMNRGDISGQRYELKNKS